ncbi:MAG: hypothetical protein D6701_08720 [Gemmatimonadetes bacterium]|nr:MAG: hypothetical protein D6701_08720 [Gemmatimonadota bacterium]
MAALGVATAPAGAQQVDRSLGVGFVFQGYSFDQSLGVDAANLFMIPVAYRQPLGERFTAELYTAWAEGRVEQADRTFVLNGPVDTRLRATYQATPWALVTVSANFPTGNARHDTREAVVASVLSSDLLGFREATWGTGFAVTAGVATAHRLGSWGLGLGGSVRLTDGYQPQADTSFSYTPGNEVRLRVALDRQVGETGTFTGGLSYQTFSSDEVDGRNLFQAGDRLRADASYAFRAGGSTYRLFAANVWRDNGDLSLPIINDAGAVVGDTVIVTSWQNVFIAGVSGAFRVGPTLYLRPAVDFRVQSREAGQDAGSGWLLGASADLPLRVFGSVDLFPRVRITVGGIKGPGGSTEGFWGGEAGATLRFR